MKLNEQIEMQEFADGLESKLSMLLEDIASIKVYPDYDRSRIQISVQLAPVHCLEMWIVNLPEYWTVTTSMRYNNKTNSAGAEIYIADWISKKVRAFQEWSQ